MPLLAAMFREFQEASKKKPDAVLNKRKVQIVNRLLHDDRRHDAGRDGLHDPPVFLGITIEVELAVFQ
jgi:hypothetical protein